MSTHAPHPIRGVPVDPATALSRVDPGRRRIIPALPFLGLALALSASLTLSGCKNASSGYLGIDITGADFARDFRLPDASGAERTLAQFRGKILLVFFGFAQCPDVCPTALTRAVEVRRLLGTDASKIQVIFITVDPERDTPGVLGGYMAAFDPSFLALRGSLEQTQAAAREFRVFYQKVATGSSYTMDHSAQTFVFDPSGKVRLAIRHEASAEQFVHDLRLLMSRS